MQAIAHSVDFLHCQSLKRSTCISLKVPVKKEQLHNLLKNVLCVCEGGGVAGGGSDRALGCNPVKLVLYVIFHNNLPMFETMKSMQQFLNITIQRF